MEDTRKDEWKVELGRMEGWMDRWMNGRWSKEELKME